MNKQMYVRIGGLGLFSIPETHYEEFRNLQFNRSLNFNSYHRHKRISTPIDLLLLTVF